MEAKSAAYPAHLAHRRQLANGAMVTIRPVRPEDEAAERRFFAALSPGTQRLPKRFSDRTWNPSRPTWNSGKLWMRR